MSTISIQSDHGKLKRRIAELVGANPDRYADDLGTERHKTLTAEEIDGICDQLGIGFLDCSKQEKKDACMLKLGRDHRTGTSMWDASDLVAVIDALEETGGADDV